MLSLSCVETVLWFWNAPPLPRGLRLWGCRQGLSSASSTEKEAAERLEEGEFPVRSWGERDFTHTSHESYDRTGAREWHFLTGFPQTRGNSSGVETCIIFLPPSPSFSGTEEALLPCDYSGKAEH